MDNKEMYYKLYLQRKAAEIYPDNPDGESKARLEMIDELQSKGFNITCFTDIELGSIKSSAVMEIMLKYYDEMESIYTKETILRKIDAKKFPEVIELARREYETLSPYGKIGMLGLQATMCHGRKTEEHTNLLFDLISCPDDYAAGTTIRSYLMKIAPDRLIDYTHFYSNGVLLPSTLKELDFYKDEKSTSILKKCLLISESEIKDIIESNSYKLCPTMFAYYKRICTSEWIRKASKKLLNKSKRQ